MERVTGERLGAYHAQIGIGVVAHLIIGRGARVATHDVEMGTVDQPLTYG